MKRGIHFKKTLSCDQVDIVTTGPSSRDIAGIDKGIVFKTTMRDTALLLLNSKAAFKGYAYLLVTKGYGCMCNVVLDKLHTVNTCFEETKKIFSKIVDLHIEEPKNVGGIGSFSAHTLFKRGKTLYVGEAAGLQDFLWGFGMRYAVMSGFLAAKSIITHEDYEKTAKKYFNHKIKASITNRYVWENCRKRHYSLLVKNGKIMRKLLYSVHNFNSIQKIVYPFAVSYLQKRYPHLQVTE